MHGDQVLLRQLRPERVLEERPAERHRPIAQPLGDRLENRLAPDARPVDAQATVVEVQPAAAVVVRHHEVDERVVHRAAVRAAPDAVELAPQLVHPVAGVRVLAEELRRRREEQRRAPAEPRRDRPVLDHHSAVEQRLPAHVDHACDRRPHRLLPVGVQRPVADAVDGDVAVVGEAEHVAVAGEAVAKAIGERQARLARAQQDLGRAQRAGAEHDDVRTHEHRRCFEPFAAGVERLEVDEPMVVAPFEPTHGDTREDLRAVRFRVGQVVHLRRVLGADVATRDAVSAERACALLDADMVDAVGERDVDRRAIARRPDRLRRALERLELAAGAGSDPDRASA